MRDGIEGLAGRTGVPECRLGSRSEERIDPVLFSLMRPDAAKHNLPEYAAHAEIRCPGCATAIAPCTLITAQFIGLQGNGWGRERSGG